VVALRPSIYGSGSNPNDQKNYFEKQLGFRPSFSDELGYTSNYSLIDSSDVVIGLQSALLFEALSRGVRTIMCFPHSGDLSLVPAITGMSNLCLQSDSDLTTRLRQVISTSHTEYFQSLQPSVNYFIKERANTVSLMQSAIRLVEDGYELNNCV
jgi:hypothetical protein